MDQPELEGVTEAAEASAMAVHLQNIKAALRDEHSVRVDFGFALSASGSVETAQVWQKTQVPMRYGGGMTNKWVKVGPFLTTKEGTRASLFTLLAHLSEEAGDGTA